MHYVMLFLLIVAVTEIIGGFRKLNARIDKVQRLFDEQTPTRWPGDR